MSVARSSAVGRVNAANGAARTGRSPMKYLLTIYTDESSYASISPEQSSAMLEGYGEVGREAQEAGALIGDEHLQPTATATTVRVRDGEPLFTAGPFPETREQLA